MTGEKKIDLYLSFYEDEMNSALLYEEVARNEKNPKLAEVYQRLAATERNHAATWRKKLEEAGVSLEPFKPSWRTRTMLWLSRRLGVEAILPSLSNMEMGGSHAYTAQDGGGQMAASEQSHARLLRLIGKSMHGGLEGGALAKLEGRHRTAGGNALRAAVLGANDGLVSNFSLVMGVAGAAVAGKGILLSGLAGLLAGSISMALGEWISVQSSRELYKRQIEIELEEIEQAPEEEMEELALIYQSRGLDESAARQLAGQIMSNPQNAIDALSRDELGIDPDELGGSAWEAALTSFLLFALGAILPVLPYFFLSGIPAIAASTGLSALGLFVIGAAITLFTGRPVWSSGLRQVAFGLAAAAITYLVGRMLGVSVLG